MLNIKMIFSSIYLFIYNFINGVISTFRRIVRSITKWFLRRTTKLCELQRIMYGTLDGYERVSQIEFSLSQSKNPKIRAALEYMNQQTLTNDFLLDYEFRKSLFVKVTYIIAREKGISVELHKRFYCGMEHVLLTLCALQTMKLKTEAYRTTAFRMNNEEDEEKLLEIWNCLMDEKLTGINSKQWSDLGFQGMHPATDFRGAGMLAVTSLLYLAHNYNEFGKQLVSLSHHPKHGYPFGCVSIHISYFAFQLLTSKSGMTHFYNIYDKYRLWNGDQSEEDERKHKKAKDSYYFGSGDRLLSIFYEFYVALLFRFNNFWFQMQPESILEFNAIFQKFQTIIHQELTDPQCRFEPIFKIV